jgi:serine protease AprX
VERAGSPEGEHLRRQLRERLDESRNSVLWGDGKKTRRVLALVTLALAVAVASADVSNGGATPVRAFVPKALAASAAATPDEIFHVIVQRSPRAVTRLSDAIEAARKAHPGKGTGLTRKFAAIDGVAADLTGAQLEQLADDPAVGSISDDAAVYATGYSNTQIWPAAAGVSASWGPTKASFPTIAVVDSGIDTTKSDFGSRVLKTVNLVSAGANSAGDGRGHGTFVAGIAAGDDPSYTGSQPRAKLVSLDVLDDQGMGSTSDVIAACDWILQNKATYNIRVANFSLNAGGASSSFRWDPLDKAVEKLWLNGVVVVVSAGNYGTGSGASGVLFAPANDPFVITVGASDVNGTIGASDDFAAPWSAYGYTNDGFLKPDLSAPGRVLYGPVPASSTMLAEHPERQVAPGRMWMSGTSFAAPVVSGAAAWLLADHPTWTPDQVKGALMAGASSPTGYSGGGSLGVGVLNGDRSDTLSGRANPNAALNQFTRTDGATGLRVFDDAAWAIGAQANLSWDQASWSSASWSEASWNEASWSGASWCEASWASASWSDAAWSETSLSQASWASGEWVP